MPRTHSQAIAFLLGFWLALALSPLIVTTAGGAEPSDPTSLEADLLTQVNRVRSDHHLIPLVRRTDLDRVALAHSADMAQRGYFSHQSPDHRGNLLAPALNLTGIGIARGADGSLIYTQVYILVPR